MKDRCELLPALFADYSWNLNGYARKLPFCGNGNLTMSEAIRVFQITPEPLASDSNECVREAIRQKDLAWFSFFLHHYERRLNGQILRFFARNNMDRNDAERFLDYKLECMQMLLYGLAKYDPEQNADFPKYAAHYIRDGLLFSRVLEEAGSFSSLAEYRRVRQIGAIYNECNKNKAETVSRFTEKAGYNKTSETADELLTVAQLIAISFRSTVPDRTRTARKPARMSPAMTVGTMPRFYGTAFVPRKFRGRLTGSTIVSRRSLKSGWRSA